MQTKYAVKLENYCWIKKITFEIDPHHEKKKVFRSKVFTHDVDKSQPFIFRSHDSFHICITYVVCIIYFPNLSLAGEKTC